MNTINTESSNMDSDLETIRTRLSEVNSSIQETYANMLTHVLLNDGFDLDAADTAKITVLAHMNSLREIGELVAAWMRENKSSSVDSLVAFVQATENRRAVCSEMDTVNGTLAISTGSISEASAIAFVLLNAILIHLKRACDCFEVVVGS